MCSGCWINIPPCDERYKLVGMYRFNLLALIILKHLVLKVEKNIRFYNVFYFPFISKDTTAWIPPKLRSLSHDNFADNLFIHYPLSGI